MFTIVLGNDAGRVVKAFGKFLSKNAGEKFLAKRGWEVHKKCSEIWVHKRKKGRHAEVWRVRSMRSFSEI